MKKLLLGLTISLAACSSPEPSELQERPVLATTVEELVAAYEANEMSAQQRFGNVSVRVAATVDSIKLNGEDEPFVNLVSDTMLPVQASFLPAYRDATGGLSKGQSIVLLCESVSEVLGSPMLGGCRVAG